MKTNVSPRALVFLFLSLLAPLAAGNQERQQKTKVQSPPMAEHYLPAPAISVPNAGVATPDRQKLPANNRHTRSAQREVFNRELNRYEVDSQSFFKGLAAASVARRQIAER